MRAAEAANRRDSCLAQATSFEFPICGVPASWDVPKIMNWTSHDLTLASRNVVCEQDVPNKRLQPRKILRNIT